MNKLKAYKVWSGAQNDGMFNLAETFKQAIKWLATQEENIKRIKTHTVGISIVDCGRCHCGRLEIKEWLEQDGECLLCQKIRYDVQLEAAAEKEK